MRGILECKSRDFKENSAIKLVMLLSINFNNVVVYSFFKIWESVGEVRRGPFGGEVELGLFGGGGERGARRRLERE